MIDEIIIDGVNVKDCKRRIGKDNFCRYYKRYCAENNYNCIWKKYLRKEQECEELKKDLHQNFKEKDKLHLIIDRLLEASGYNTNTTSAEDFEDVYENMRYEKQQLDQLKAEIKSKIEYIQEQREVIDKYSKEIEMYKKCQGKRASKREEKLKQTITEIKKICRFNFTMTTTNLLAKTILQKISECEVNND